MTLVQRINLSRVKTTFCPDGEVLKTNADDVAKGHPIVSTQVNFYLCDEVLHPSVVPSGAYIRIIPPNEYYYYPGGGG